ncbi:hypothetical protein HYR99_12880 [Candidatus Poribacteria bacterium]|nr:hypothetical protein [Candidatus Poribacteria bacterium]
MNVEETLLIDSPLVPDPDADEEMGSTDVEALADEDLKGSRLLLVRRAIEPIDLEGIPGGVLQLACTFQPGQGTRFTSAQFRLRLVTPDGIRIIDLAPRSLDDPNPVEFTLNRKGQLGITSLPVPIEPSVEIGSSKKYVRYHCRVQGSGEGTSLARWDFKENPDRRDGIGQEQVLTLTLPVKGQVTGRVIVSARLARSGLRGSIEAIRDMILGAKPNERSYPITFEIPEAPSPNGLARFLRLF